MYFELGDKVEIVDTYAEGTIVGKASYINGTTSYFVRFVDPAGNLVKQWFENEDLDAVDEDDQLEPVDDQEFIDDISADEGYDDDGGFSDDSDEEESDDDDEDVDYDYGWK